MKASTATHLKASVEMIPPCPTSSPRSPTTLVQPGGWPAGKSFRCWRGGSLQKARFSTCWNGRGPPLTNYPSEAAQIHANQRRDRRSHQVPVFSRLGVVEGNRTSRLQPLPAACQAEACVLLYQLPESQTPTGFLSLSLSILHSTPLKLFIGSSHSTLAVTPDLRPESVFHCPQLSIF